MMNKKQIIILILIVISFVASFFVSNTIARYVSNIAGQANVDIAKPIIEIVNLSSTSIADLDKNNQEITFDVVNYDGSPREINEVLLQYLLSFETTTDLPIEYTLYKLDSLGVRQPIELTENTSSDFLMEHTVEQVDSFVLVVSIDDVNYQDTQDKINISLKAVQMNYDIVFRNTFKKYYTNQLPINLIDEIEYINYANRDLHYNVSISNSKFNLTIPDGTTRELITTSDKILTDELAINISLKPGEIANGYEEIDLIYSITEPFNYQKVVTIIYDIAPPYNYSPTIVPDIDRINISGVGTDNVSSSDKLTYYYKIDAGEYVEGKTEYTFLDLFPEQQYVISVKVVDEAGNELIFTQTVATLSYVTDGLILHFDGIRNTRAGNNPLTTSWEDLSGGNHDGTIVRATYDSVRKAYQFFGTTVTAANRSSINIPTTFKSTLPATVEIVAATGKKSGIMYYDHLGQIAIGYYDTNDGLITTGQSKTNQPLFSVASTPFHSGNPFTLAVSYNNTANSSRSAYVNTSVLSNIAVNNYWTGDTSMNFIGRRFNDTQPYEGYMYAIRIYNRVLTSEELLRNYTVDKMRFNYN